VKGDDRLPLNGTWLTAKANGSQGKRHIGGIIVAKWKPFGSWDKEGLQEVDV